MWKQFAAIGAVGGAAVAASQYINNESTATPYHERYSRDLQAGNILKAIGNTPRKYLCVLVLRASFFRELLVRANQSTYGAYVSGAFQLKLFTFPTLLLLRVASVGCSD